VSEDDVPSLPPGTLIAGKFRIEKLLGAGAMGAVYAIEHMLTHHRRALKLLHPHVVQNTEIVRRFLNEASAAGRAGSPHLVETFDAGTLPTGEPYLVMEMLDGESMGHMLERERALGYERAADLVAQAAEGIAAAHRAGIIHRDLKPDNLFITAKDGKPFVKILDFGVSKFAEGPSTLPGDHKATRAGAMIGSPAYMSREQIFGSTDIDARTDVFSLGVVLYEALTGTRPFEAPTLEQLAMRITTGTSTPIETLRPDLPVGLMEVVRQAIAADREQRLPSAQALVEALKPYRSATTTQVAPPVSNDLGLMKTIAETTPAGALSSVSAVTGMTAPPKSKAPLAVVGAGVVTVLAVVGLLLARSREPAAISMPSDVSAKQGVSAAPTPPASFLAAVPAPAPLAPAEAPSAAIAPLPEAGVAVAHRAPSPARPPAPAAAAAPASTPAKPNLGLSQENPFR
jgi:serine/threonine-protein kinase